MLAGEGGRGEDVVCARMFCIYRIVGIRDPRPGVVFGWRKLWGIPSSCEGTPVVAELWRVPRTSLDGESL